MTVARLELKNRVYRLATSVRRLRSGSHGASGNEEIVFSDQFLPRRCHQPRRLPLAKMSQQRYRRVASLHCGLTVPQGDSRTNGISDRESNSQPNCENHQDFGHALATPTANS
jgi:hypothetical protein